MLKAVAPPAEMTPVGGYKLYMRLQKYIHCTLLEQMFDSTHFSTHSLPHLVPDLTSVTDAVALFVAVLTRCVVCVRFIFR